MGKGTKRQGGGGRGGSEVRGRKDEKLFFSSGLHQNQMPCKSQVLHFGSVDEVGQVNHGSRTFLHSYNNNGFDIIYMVVLVSQSGFSLGL